MRHDDQHLGVEHTCGGPQMFGDPNALASLRKKPLMIRPAPPPPLWKATASGPCLALISFSLLATVVSASSHEMRSHLPSPFSPTRLNGYLSLSGAYTHCITAYPLEHRAPWFGGTFAGSILTIFPSSKW